MRRSAFLAAAPSGASLPGRLGPGSSLGGVVVFGLLLLGMAAPPVRDLAAQEVPDSTPERIPASVASKSSPGASRLPASLLLGVGFGRRSDPCAVCPSPENTDSFTGHVSLSRPLGHGFGVGVDGSVWRRSHPGPLGAPDSTGVPSPTKLGSTLGNVSVTFSFEIWQLFFQAGGGVAWASQDLVPGGGVATVGGAGGAAAGEGGSGAAATVTASGLGVGYTVGGGFVLPVAPPVSLVFFANLNAGSYDLATPYEVVERGARHRYLEVGIGVAAR
ncbi:MAG: hypothetical protein ACE5GJ_08905 [Gemmatimonadota bacterium]